MKTVNDFLLARQAAFHADASEQFELAEQLKKSADDVRSEDECCEEAAMFYRAAAEKGHAQAQYELALMYQYGLGLEQNFFLSARWYRRASKQGHGESIRRLVHLYRTGKGVRKSGFAALRWKLKYADLRAARRKERSIEDGADCPAANPAGQDQAQAETPPTQGRIGNGGPKNA